ncbi:hypothetical protein SAMN03159341_11650 [Paenibacillus sp. 1_12]|nr:hypothetical protein SAMN03159341_11650 [Paenibacillus sp. 1_12]
MVGLCTALFYGSYVRIVAFVVDSNQRKKGIEKAYKRSGKLGK